MERRFLDTLPERLTAALSAGDLERATRPPDGADVARSFGAGHVRIDGRLVAHHVPRVTLAVDPPADARELCAAWAIAEPVAVSPDVEQRTWQLCVAGRELPDPYARRIASDAITAGRWDVIAYLAARPAGALPGVVSGASPAYDVRERGGAIRSIEITPTAHVTKALEPGHADVRALLGVMATAHPAWRGSGAGWTPDPAATFVVIYEAGTPVAGGALSPASGAGAARASQVCVVPVRRGAYLGAALLDTLEAVARGQGAAALRLDSSAFLLGDELPLTRCGYAIEPAYAGSADVEVWAEKELAGPA